VSKGPYLIVGAFWSDTDVTDEVADAISADVFPRAEGRLGAVVSFSEATAQLPGFARVMDRLDLAEVNAAPVREAVSPDTGTEA
jgi:hypothetical protein